MPKCLCRSYFSVVFVDKPDELTDEEYNPSYLQSLKQMFTNRSFIILTFAYGTFACDASPCDSHGGPS